MWPSNWDAMRDERGTARHTSESQRLRAPKPASKKSKLLTIEPLHQYGSVNLAKAGARRSDSTSSDRWSKAGGSIS